MPGRSAVLEAALAPLGFACHRLRFGETENLFARRGTESPHFCYAGHTDVVPPGEQGWTDGPFAGRGPRRHAVRPRRLRHEGRHRRLRRRADRLPRRQPAPRRQHQPADHRRRGRPGQGRHHPRARLDGRDRPHPRHGAGRRAHLPRRPRRYRQGRPPRQHDRLYHPVRHPGAQRLSAAGRQPDPPAGPRAAPPDRHADRRGAASSSRRPRCRSPASTSAIPRTTSSPPRRGRC